MTHKTRIKTKSLDFELALQTKNILTHSLLVDSVKEEVDAFFSEMTIKLHKLMNKIEVKGEG